MSETGIINIHGKDYQTVALRVTKLRNEHKDWSITTDILCADAESVLMKATVSDESGRVIGTGHAEEKRGKGINAMSALENCETSAIGRALAACGYGGTEYASANEMSKVEPEYISESMVADIKIELDELKVDIPKFLSWLKVDAIEKIPVSDIDKVMTALTSKREALNADRK
jgi:hypothetical protein